MELQTEGSNPDAVQAALDHREGCHFFRHKEYGFAVSQRVCNQGGNRLGFSGAGRAMKDKALPIGGLLDGIELGCVCGQREQRIPFLHGNIGLHGFGVPGQPALDQAAHQGIFLQVVHAVADIVPHHELIEGKDTQKGGLYYIPAGLVHDGPADHRVHGAQIHAMFILRQGVQTTHGNTEILFEHFQQRDIHLRLLIPQPDDITFIGRFPHDLDGQQHQRSIARPLAVPGLIPAQQAEGQIEGVGSVFFQRAVGGAVELGDGAV